MKHTKHKTLAASIALASMLSVGSQAAPLSLDSSFSGDGYHAENYGTSQSFFKDVAVTPDDKIIAVGSVLEPTATTSYQGLIVRYNANGSVDGSFGGVNKIIGQYDTRFDAVVVQADGKILAGGHSRASSSAAWRLNVTRFNTNGTIDTSFATNGTYSLNIPNPDSGSVTGSSLLKDIALNADGDILISAVKYLNKAFNLNRYSSHIIKLSAQGVLDTNFGSTHNANVPDGITSITRTNEDYQGNKITLDVNGDIYLPGRHQAVNNGSVSQNNKTMFLQRIKADGNHINGTSPFASTGQNRWELYGGPLGGSNTIANQTLTSSVALPTGEIVSVGCNAGNYIIGGSFNQPIYKRLRIQKQSALGVFDSGFAANGVYIAGYNSSVTDPSNECLSDLNFHPGVGLVAVGNTTKPLVLLLDENTGVKSADFELTMDGMFHSVATLSNGKIVAVGQTTATPGESLISVFSGAALPAATTTINTLTFNDDTDVPLNSVRTASSNNSVVITPSGPLTANVTNGAVQINSAPFVSGTVTLNDGDNVSLQHTSSSDVSTATVTTMTVATGTGFNHNNKSWAPGAGSTAFTFTSTTEAADTMPDAFTLQPASSTPAQRQYISYSNIVTVAGVNTDAPISIVGGSYQVNNSGGYVTAPGTVKNGDIISVRHFNSNLFATQTTSTLTIGTVSGSFSSTTEAEDTSPNGFSFGTSTGNKALNSQIDAGTITVTGINSATLIIITNGEYRIGTSGSFTSSNGFVNPGETVQLRHTTASDFSSLSTTTINIGGVIRNYTTRTIDRDVSPDIFTVVEQTDVELSSEIISAEFTVAGINDAVTIEVTGGEYQINGGAFTSVAGNVNNGDTVTARHTTANVNSTDTTTTLTIGGISADFVSTTKAASSSSSSSGGSTSSGGSSSGDQSATSGSKKSSGGGAVNLGWLLVLAGLIGVSLFGRKKIQ